MAVEGVWQGVRFREGDGAGENQEHQSQQGAQEEQAQGGGVVRLDDAGLGVHSGGELPGPQGEAGQSAEDGQGWENERFFHGEGLLIGEIGRAHV